MWNFRIFLSPYLLNSRAQVTEYTSTTVVVTGVGALIGQGIARSLRKIPGVRIVGVDRHMTDLARSYCDVCEQKPNVPETEPDYLDFWRDLVARTRADVVLPGLSHDVAFLRHAAPDLTRVGCAVMLNAPDLIDLCADKLIFGRALSAAGFPAIPTVRSTNWQEVCDILGDPPFLLKPRSGEGSSGIVRLYDNTDLAYWIGKCGENWMLQRIVGRDDEEYTVGIFGQGADDVVGPIILRRTLARAGHTAFAEVVENDVIRDITLRIAAHFKPVGPTNLQFRLEDGIAYLLEINPRFSSSCSLRTAFGFNEARMSLEYLRDGRVAEAVHLRRGRAWRYNEDFICYDGDHL